MGSVISRLSGARLAFQVKRVDVPLGHLQRRFASEGDRRLLAPLVEVPDLGAALQLAPIRELALKELIRHAKTGKVTLHFPVPELEQSLAVTKVKIEKGHKAVIGVSFEDGQILLSEAKGPIEPPIPLPLGLSAEGVYLARDGSIFVDIPNFPDINLSLVGLGFRIPASVEAALEQFFPDEHPEATAPDRGVPGGSEMTFSLDDFAVEARNVIPRSEPFHLGSAGQISLGEDTRLDVDFSQDRLAVRGRVQMTGGELRGDSFALLGLVGTGTITSSLDGIEQLRGVAADLQIHHGHLSRLWFALPDGTRIELEDVTVEGAEIAYSRRQGRDRFRLSARRLAGRFCGGCVVLRIGAEAHPIDLGPMSFDGGITVSDKYFDLDGEVAGAHLETRGLDLELGIARFALGGLNASASGRIKVSTDYGYSFTGALHVDAEVKDGELALGPLGAGLAAGTQVSLDIAELHGGAEGPDALVARGTAEVVLKSGVVPLGPNAELSFSRGGRGRFDLKRVELNPGSRWPHIEASGTIVAQADPAVVEEIFEIPAGTAHVEAGSAVLSEDGHLVVEDLRAWLSSDDSADGEV